MRYMEEFGNVTRDAVGLLQLKSQTYGDSWKRRGGPGAWFTVVRPLDRLEGIVARHGGDIFAAIAADPSGQDGSALACVRDIMNYMILIESEARTSLGAGPHSPATLDLMRVWMEPVGPGTPEDGGHAALATDEDHAEASVDASEASAATAPALAPLEDRVGLFRADLLALAEKHKIGVALS